MTSPRRREVVVTGVGAIGPEAMSAPALYERLAEGRSSVRLHPALALAGLPAPYGAHLGEAQWQALSASGPALGAPARLAVHAARQALQHGGLAGAPLRRAGVFVGANKTTCSGKDLIALARCWLPQHRRLDLGRFMHSTPVRPEQHVGKRQDAPAAAVAALFNEPVSALTLGDACAAGGMAIGSAMRHIRHGDLDVALAGAAEAMCNYVPMVGFGILGALCGLPSDQPHTLSRPFDKARSGFLMGEGSAFLLLESEGHARRRGAAVLARVSGFARQAEAWRITSSPPGGASYARCMQAALADAGLAPGDIDHVNAHGTSTVNNDACEAAAIRSVYGERAARLPVTSNKSALGHSLAASGALEAVLCVMSLQRQQLLPTLNFHEAGPDTAGIAVVQETRAATLRHVASHSFGFGGENCVLVFSR